jgi:hypothetical protein
MVRAGLDGEHHVSKTIRTISKPPSKSASLGTELSEAELKNANDTSNIGTLEDHDIIGDTDLGAVTGAWNAVEHVAIGPSDSLIDALSTAARTR